MGNTVAIDHRSMVHSRVSYVLATFHESSMRLNEKSFVMLHVVLPIDDIVLEEWKC
jgi:hypothetical protein